MRKTPHSKPEQWRKYFKEKANENTEHIKYILVAFMSLY